MVRFDGRAAQDAGICVKCRKTEPDQLILFELTGWEAGQSRVFPVCQGCEKKLTEFVETWLTGKNVELRLAVMKNMSDSAARRQSIERQGKRWKPSWKEAFLGDTLCDRCNNSCNRNEAIFIGSRWLTILHQNGETAYELCESCRNALQDWESVPL